MINFDLAAKSNSDCKSKQPIKRQNYMRVEKVTFGSFAPTFQVKNYSIISDWELKITNLITK